jgi:alkylresorcinol/alkylpyrone synthase
MASIVATAACSPAHRYEQAFVKERVREWLDGAGGAAARALSAFDHGLVERRSSALPIDEVFAARGFGASNDLYIRHAVDLATTVTERALQEAGLRPADVDFFVSTSCTGYMIPSVDAHVAERLRMKAALRRLPITEHGCAGGAVALGCAHDHLASQPGRVALVVSVELPSLTFQTGDLSPENVVSAALFGDGAAAAVLTSERRGGRPRIVRCASRRFRESLDWMGFRLKDSGLHVVLSREIPKQVREHTRGLVTAFLDECGLSLADVRHFLFHPGGRKILEAFVESLELPPAALAASQSVLREHGNLSSATVLFVLDEHLRRTPAAHGEHGLVLAFGPGFGAEMLLLRWD